MISIFKIRTLSIGWLTLTLFFMPSCQTKTNYEYPFQNPDLTLDERVNDLVSHLTLEEKTAQLLYDAPAIERLGIPAYNWWNECLHGVARNGKATVFPQAIALAATFDTALMAQIGIAVSDEARAKYHDAIARNKHGIYQGLTFWTPNINIFRDPRWGRGMETYGEDPYLTSQLAIAYIRNLQGNHPNYFKTIATSKHFVVHSGPEPDRHSFDAIATDRDLLDTYLPHFKATIEQANVQSVMCAYNRVNGEPCCGSNALLNELLRNQWGFQGYIVSDCWALVDFHNGHNVTKNERESAALAMKSGTDLNCGYVYHYLAQAVRDSLVPESLVDVAVKRIFKARFQLGMFDPAERVPFAQIPMSVVASKEHHELSLKAAHESMVLLKNQNNTLPLSKNLKTIAVIGPNANNEEVLLANYNGYPEKAITPLQGISEKLGAQTTILYEQGCEVAENMPNLVPIPSKVLFADVEKIKNGLNAQIFNNTTNSTQPTLSELHPNIDFNWWEGSPAEGIQADSFAVKWTGALCPETSGEYYLGAEGLGYYCLVFNGDTLVKNETMHEPQKVYQKVQLNAGETYPIELVYKNFERMALVKLLWSVPEPNRLANALTAAKNADAVVLFMGLSPRLEGEEMKVDAPGFKGGDRLTLDLPQTQQQLIKEIIKLKKPTVLVLLNGSALSINWENENVPAILEAWYPGEAAGTAIANILFGDYNPSGRLPVTFYKSVTDLPDFSNYAMKGRTYRYFAGEPLYEFGYGLSYTQFSYSDINLSADSLSAKGGIITASVTVTNTGKMAGDEVVQLYIQNTTYADAPLKELKGIQRITLKPGESKIVSFTITSDLLSVLVTPTQSHTHEGVYNVMLGSSSSDKNLKTKQITSFN